MVGQPSFALAASGAASSSEAAGASRTHEPDLSAERSPAATVAATPSAWTLDPPLHPSQLQLLPPGTVGTPRTSVDLPSHYQLHAGLKSPGQPHEVEGVSAQHAMSIWGPASAVKGPSPMQTWPPAPVTPSTVALAWTPNPGVVPGSAATPLTADAAYRSEVQLMNPDMALRILLHIPLTLSTHCLACTLAGPFQCLAAHTPQCQASALYHPPLVTVPLLCLGRLPTHCSLRGLQLPMWVHPSFQLSPH